MPQHKLEQVTIHGFQSIRRLDDFKLNDINVLIGANGAGKSNFVNYFRMLSELVEKRLQIWVQKRGGADRVLTFGVKETAEIYSHLQFGQNAYSFRLEPTDDGGFVFTDETTSYKDGSWTINRGHTESELKGEAKSKGYYSQSYFCYSAISSWKIFHFHDTSDIAGMKLRVSLDDAKYLRTDASNIAAYLYRVQQENPDAYSQIRKVVQLAIPFFDDFVLEPRTINGDDQDIRLLWRQKNSDYPLWPTQLSDGSIRFICLATALLQPNPPSTIIIDEPELGLHPYAITLLGSLIRSASKRMQVIISTQSVPLLNEFEIEDLIIVEREADVSVFKRLDKKTFSDWLEDYTVGELWEKNILGGRP